VIDRRNIRQELQATVLAILDRDHQPLCARCLSVLVKAPHSVVHAAMLEIERMDGFLQRFDQCAACRKSRVVVGRR
jgi:hypothetical protein